MFIIIFSAQDFLIFEMKLVCGRKFIASLKLFKLVQAIIHSSIEICFPIYCQVIIKSYIDIILKFHQFIFLFVQDVQHELLLAVAERTQDMLEHCRLMLLLISKLPQAIDTQGVRI